MIIGRLLAMRWSILLFALATTALAQNGPGPCTEAAIRSAIQSNKITHSDDQYLYFGRLNKPVIGKLTPADLDSTRAVKKDASSPPQPQRIVVSSAGDMAYEYGSAHVIHDLVDGEHVDFSAAYLRVWKAVGNSCEQAAMQIVPEKLSDLLKIARTKGAQ